MIPIAKPAPPAVLLNRGAAATRSLCETYESARDDYDSGDKRFSFDESLYKAKSVKETLLGAQHRKCAFCESFFTHIAYGDIEHFRPKGGYKQRESDPLNCPGYYWLAYDWQNLFYSCQLCNQRVKRNLFPLKNTRQRARSHLHELQKEEPLIIDPGTKDPADFIGFREESAYSVDGRPEGRPTIEVLGLNRNELVEVRRDRLQTLKYLVLCRDVLLAETPTTPTSPHLDQLRSIQDRLLARISTDGEYSAMARCYLAERDAL